VIESQGKTKVTIMELWGEDNEDLNVLLLYQLVNLRLQMKVTRGILHENDDGGSMRQSVKCVQQTFSDRSLEDGSVINTSEERQEVFSVMTLLSCEV